MTLEPIPAVAGAMLWQWILNPSLGLINLFLTHIGIRQPPGWYADVHWAMPSLVLMSLWGVGNFMIIYLAALGDIPSALYEAAELDGAGPVRRFWHITLPMLSPVIFFNLVMGLIHAIQAFTQVYIVSEGVGAPAGSTLVLSLYIFLAAFKYLEMGYASAVAWTLLVLTMAITLALFRTSRRWVYYQGVVR